MKRNVVAVIGIGILVAGSVVTGSGFAKTENNEAVKGTIRIENRSEAQFPSIAEISLTEAVNKALASVAGQVLKVDLEDENGFLVYGLEVVSAAGSIMDVKVDAGTGNILAIERDDADDEDHESDRERDE